MLIFAIFTLGYFAGVFTALLFFPPNTNELKEQEIDALQPILRVEEEKRLEQKVEDDIYQQPALITNH